ncbi:DUF937 domain-containing protein [Microbacterium sp. cf046]|uniref:DUF937 domain-containing protein n=1 Tax=Microbacterium sp. cf046 TaxID=1761803 RepID=UPI000B898C03|nr:DUF937 domain-containing protein [Microbacterium sp. cf046]
MDDILEALPIDDIAAQLGVDPSEARRAIEEGGATILSGLQRNAQTPEGASALEKALGKHGSEVSGGTVDLNALDTADGQKILGHIFGGQEQAVAQKLTDEPKTAGIDFGKLLPILAPIILGLIANRQKGAAPDSSAPADGGGGLGDLIGGLLGGGATGSGGAAPGGIDIGGLLGGLLGGQK